jgi:hypothetical protein
MNKTTLVVLVGRKLGDAEQTLMYLIVCEQRVDALQAKTKENKKTSVKIERICSKSLCHHKCSVC